MTDQNNTPAPYDSSRKSIECAEVDFPRTCSSAPSPQFNFGHFPHFPAHSALPSGSALSAFRVCTFPHFTHCLPHFLFRTVRVCTFPHLPHIPHYLPDPRSVCTCISALLSFLFRTFRVCTSLHTPRLHVSALYALPSALSAFALSALSTLLSALSALSAFALSAPSATARTFCVCTFRSRKARKRGKCGKLHFGRRDKRRRLY